MTNCSAARISEIGTQARSMHKCQGMAQLLALPGPGDAAYSLVESTIPVRRIATRSCSPTASIRPSPRSRSMPARVRRKTRRRARWSPQVRGAAAFDAGNDDGAVAPLLAGLHVVRVLRAQLRGMTIDEPGRFDIEFRLRQKEREFQQAIIIANGLRIDALSNDGVVVPGQDVRLSLIVANNGAGEVAIRQAKFSGFAGDGSCGAESGDRSAGFRRPGRTRAGIDAPPPVRVSSLKKDVAGRCDVTMKIPQTARVTEPHMAPQGRGRALHLRRRCAVRLPFRPTEFYGEVASDFLACRADRPRKKCSARCPCMPAQRRHLQWREAVGC
jgi:hypothetical protein